MVRNFMVASSVTNPAAALDHVTILVPITADHPVTIAVPVPVTELEAEPRPPVIVVPPAAPPTITVVIAVKVPSSALPTLRGRSGDSDAR
jgi:hypothetical protein